MSAVANVPRTIPDRLQGRTERALKSWESLLFVVMVVIFIINGFLSLQTSRKIFERIIWIWAKEGEFT